MCSVDNEHRLAKGTQGTGVAPQTQRKALPHASSEVDTRQTRSQAWTANLDQPPILHADSRETRGTDLPTHVNKWHPASTTLHPTAVTGVHTQQTPSTCCCTGDPICRQWHPASPVVLTTGYWCSSKHVACSALGTFTLHHLCHHSLPHTGLVETPYPPHRSLWPLTSSETLEDLSSLATQDTGVKHLCVAGKHRAQSAV